MIEPMAAVSAAEEPDSPENIMVDSTTTIPRPPRMWPTSTLASWISRMDMPPVSMRPPARMKKGTASSGKESSPVNILWATMVSGMFP